MQICFDKHVMLSTADKSGTIKSISHHFTEITGYAEEDTLGKQYNILKCSDTSKELHQDLWKTILSGEEWGGEEFLIVACETKIEEAFVLAENLRQAVENYVFPIVKKITISGGVTQYAENETTSALVSKADKALYQAKTSGRNKVIQG